MIRYLVEKIAGDYYFNCDNKGKDIRELEQFLNNIPIDEVAVKGVTQEEYRIIYNQYCKREINGAPQ